MLNITVRSGDTVLAYAPDTGKLQGRIVCQHTDSPVSLQFDMEGLVLVREALVRRVSDDITVCPPSLLARFNSPAPRKAIPIIRVPRRVVRRPASSLCGGQ
ncbi:hypothetical protein H10PHJ05_20 [Aeromonas phage HJ05]|nr:hypothetical protein H10PHJ05_20 [Aeromonas phage HJ05]